MKLETKWYLDGVSNKTYTLSWVLRIIVFFTLISPIYTKDQLGFIKLFLLLDIAQYLYLAVYFDLMAWRQHLKQEVHHYWIHMLPAYILFYLKVGVIIYGVLL